MLFLLLERGVIVRYKEPTLGRFPDICGVIEDPGSVIYKLCSAMDRRFEIEGEITRHYIRFNATGTQLTVR